MFPSAEILPRILPGSFRDPSAYPSAESFRGSFRKILPRASFQKSIFQWRNHSAESFRQILPRILPGNPSAGSLLGNPSAEKIVYELTFTGSFRGSFWEILPRASFRESSFQWRNPSAESFRKILPRILLRFRQFLKLSMSSNIVGTYVRTYVHTYVRTCVRTYARTHVRTYVRTYVRK